jgi:hypothetical protein
MKVNIENAIQERSTTKDDVRDKSEIGEEIRGGNSEGKETPGESPT